MSLYVYPDGHYSLHLGTSPQSVQNYLHGKRTLVHVPVAWPELLAPKPSGFEDPDGLAVFAQRPLRPGDEVGLYCVPPPRVRITPITSIEAMPLHDMEIGDLVSLGRTEQDLEAYKTSWDECWDAELAWAANPDVFAIRWEPLKA